MILDAEPLSSSTLVHYYESNWMSEFASADLVRLFPRCGSSCRHEIGSNRTERRQQICVWSQVSPRLPSLVHIPAHPRRLRQLISSYLPL